MTDAQPDLRVSDADRQQVVDRLREETANGRLTLDEFDERAGEAYAARTQSELEHTLRELPAVWTPPQEPVAFAAPADGPPDLEERARKRYRDRIRKQVSGFVITNATCITVWAMTGPGGDFGTDHYFWPAWVLLGTGIGLTNHITNGRKPDRRAITKEWERQQKRATRGSRRLPQRSHR